MNGSPKFSINRDDVVRILENTAIAAAAGAVGYLSQSITGLNVPGSVAVFIPVAASLLSTLHKYLTGTRV